MKPSELLRRSIELVAAGDFVEDALEQICDENLSYDGLERAEELLLDASSTTDLQHLNAKPYPEVLAAFEAAAQLAEQEGQ